MTKYYDKHGTEITRGCVITRDGGITRHDVFEPSLFVGFSAPFVVLSRADGTPVYRYKGGEDVRVGDWYESEFGANECVTPNHKEDAHYWPTCTLIRRAAEKPESPKTIGEARGWLIKDDPENLKKAESIQFVGVRRQYGHKFDRNKVCVDCGATRQCVEDSQQSCPVMGHSPGVEAIDRFCDWLAQPTLADRFVAFKHRVTDLVARTPIVRADFDCDMKRGPHVWLSCPGTPEPIGFSEHATDAQIREQLQYWAKHIGRNVLRGKEKLSR